MEIVQVDQAAAYQRIRLWSGIFSIGSNLVLVWVAFFIVGWMPEQWFGAINWMGWLMLTILAFNLYGLIFDKLIGFELERYRGTTAQSAGAWLRDWVLGAAVQSVLMFTGLSLWVMLVSYVNPYLFIFCICLSAGAAVWALPQIFLTKWKCSSKPDLESEVLVILKEWGVPIKRICWYDDGATAVLNGSLLPSCSDTVWLTDAVGKLAPRAIALLIRREFHFRIKGYHVWTLIIVCCWVGAGAALALGLPTVNAWQQAMALAAVMTTWCFLALFIWPPLNRRWMRSADRSMLEVASVVEVTNLLRLLQESNESDVALSGLKQGIFHPIPSLENRIKELL